MAYKNVLLLGVDGGGTARPRPVCQRSRRGKRSGTLSPVRHELAPWFSSGVLQRFRMLRWNVSIVLDLPKTSVLREWWPVSAGWLSASEPISSGRSAKATASIP